MACKEKNCPAAGYARGRRHPVLEGSNSEGREGKVKKKEWEVNWKLRHWWGKTANAPAGCSGTPDNTSTVV